MPILERCNVIAYNYDKSLFNTKKELDILKFISSEYKILIKFNSELSDKIDDKNDDKIWEKIYKFKVLNKDINDNKDNKSRFKFKFLRCRELYNLYGENLSNFRIYPDYIGKLTKSEWNEYLLEFEKLYNSTIKKNITLRSKNDKIFNINGFNNKKYKRFILLSFILKNRELIKNNIIYNNNEKEYNNHIYCENKNPRTKLRNCKGEKILNSNKCKYHSQFCDKHNRNYNICKCKKIKCKFYPNCKYRNKCNYLHI